MKAHFLFFKFYSLQKAKSTASIIDLIFFFLTENIQRLKNVSENFFRDTFFIKASLHGDVIV